MIPIDSQVKGQCQMLRLSLVPCATDVSLNLVQTITQERFASETSNLVGR